MGAIGQNVNVEVRNRCGVFRRISKVDQGSDCKRSRRGVSDGQIADLHVDFACLVFTIAGLGVFAVTNCWTPKVSYVQEMRPNLDHELVTNV